MTVSPLSTAPARNGSLEKVKPTIHGTQQVGFVLTACHGHWTEGATYTYQWYRDGKAIPGATRKTFTLTEKSRGKVMSVHVKGSRPGYTSATRYSSKTAPIKASDLTFEVPTVHGTVKVGETLTAWHGKWSEGTTFAYQWYRVGRKIPGANGKTYVLTAESEGQALAVHVTGSKPGCGAVPTYSKRTLPVEA